MGACPVKELEGLAIPNPVQAATPTAQGAASFKRVHHQGVEINFFQAKRYPLRRRKTKPFIHSLKA
jgi:hypothetical protein